MHKIGWLLLPVVFLAGAGTAIVAHQVMKARSGPFGLRGSAAPKPLGARLMRRVAEGFVAVRPAGAGFIFFDRPLPFGNSLCRTNAYLIAQKVVTGRLVRPQDRWDDPLEVGVRYGAWRGPVRKDSSDARDKACAKFQDFDNLFVAEGDPPYPERATFLIDALATAARRDAELPFPVSCHTVAYETLNRACDGRQVLRNINVQQLRRSKVLSFTYAARFGDSRDELTLWPAYRGTHTWIRLIVASRQRWGRDSISEGEVTSAAVEVDRR